MNYDDLVTVYSVSNPVEARLIKNSLEVEGIRCVLEGAEQGGAVGTLMIPIKLQVRAADADRASKFIGRHQHVG